MHGLIKQNPSFQLQWQLQRGNEGVETHGLFIRHHEVHMMIREPRVWGADCECYVFINGQQVHRTPATTLYIGMKALEKWLEGFAVECEKTFTASAWDVVDNMTEERPDVMPVCQLCGSPVDVHPHVKSEVLVCASCRAEVS